MTQTDGQEDTEKSAIEKEKTALEKRLLQRQLSVQGHLMAWLQATSVPVALLGAVLAFFVGFGQLRQGAENQEADRFDKALTRLASTRPNERITGVSGLQLFLSARNPLLQQEALQFLINGLSLETNTRVRGAILDVLADLQPGSPSQAALDEGLRTAVERDRNLTKLIVDASRHRIAQQKKQTLTKFKIAVVDLEGMGDEIPAQVTTALTTEQYLALLDAEHTPFEMLDPSEEVPLIGLRTAIQTLVARGATSDDFKQIYCEDCDFTSAKSLDGAVFDGAYLTGADFAHVSLRRASFKNADLGGTNFFHADLTKANLRADGPLQGFASQGLDRELPLLECAKLGGADLSGQPLVIFVKEFSNMAGSIEMPRMSSVQFDASTKLDYFRTLIAIAISDAYLKRQSAAREVKYLTANRDALWENPLAEGSWLRPDFRRIHVNSTKDAAEWTHTIAMMDWLVGPDDLKRLGKDAFMLRGFVEQPALEALPLYPGLSTL